MIPLPVSSDCIVIPQEFSCTGIANVTANMDITQEVHRRNHTGFKSSLSSPHIFCQNIKALNRYRPMNPHYQHVKKKSG